MPCAHQAAINPQHVFLVKKMIEDAMDLEMFTREAQSNEAYEKIKTREAIVIGCGNVGSVLATILAEGGLTVMTIIDFDDFSFVDNRQLYSMEEYSGKNKAITTAIEISKRVPCHIKPYDLNAINLFNSARVNAKEHDVFLCVDSVEARKQIYQTMTSRVDRKDIGTIFDVGVEKNTIQVANYLHKNPSDVFKEDSGAAHCVTIPLSSFKAFMAASIMAAAYYSVFETEGTEDEAMIPPDHALQIYTNTLTTFKRKI